MPSSLISSSRISTPSRWPCRTPSKRPRSIPVPASGIGRRPHNPTSHRTQSSARPTLWRRAGGAQASRHDRLRSPAALPTDRRGAQLRPKWPSPRLAIARRCARCREIVTVANSTEATAVHRTTAISPESTGFSVLLCVYLGPRRVASIDRRPRETECVRIRPTDGHPFPSRAPVNVLDIRPPCDRLRAHSRHERGRDNATERATAAGAGCRSSFSAAAIRGPASTATRRSASPRLG